MLHRPPVIGQGLADILPGRVCASSRKGVATQGTNGDERSVLAALTYEPNPAIANSARLNS